ncbi:MULTISPECIES: hypothetical protein [Paenibacillus]|uniref:Tail tape measure protein n=1 Tax=Paenibacillus campinasensis TaxID=66347 RepID=A0ABW9SZV7_9BACL|nr:MULTISPECIES: hypothetical protein [Paenibacillus]MUG66534.1 hypothetical protein [Paenibacillus campinasensis]PAK52918.1 hypothetical protein CHH75_10835 [Paenibacillus sp. 7541]
MAESLSYRMNLVIDPKNVVKANRELRAMERYFERIEGRVMRIGRTRMAPEIVLKDSASKALDGLLEKIKRVKSEVINASASVKLHVHRQIDTLVNVNVLHVVQGLDFNPVVNALQANTDALHGLSDALGNLQIGGGQESSSFMDKALNGVESVLLAAVAMKGIGEIKDKTKSLREVLPGKRKPSQKGNTPDAKPDLNNGTGGQGKSNPQKAAQTQNKAAQTESKAAQTQSKGTPTNDKVPSTTPKKPVGKGKTLRRMAVGGDFLETVGNLTKAGLTVAKKTWEIGSNLFGGGGGGLGVVAGNTGAAKTAVNPAKTAVKSGGASGLLKGASKRLLGPLSFLADAKAIAQAEPGIERNKAIGSAIGGGIGATIGGMVGSVIPGAGTLVGSVAGGAVGSYVGEKIGGAVTGITETFKAGKENVTKWFSKTFSFGKKEKDIAQPPPVPKPVVPAPPPSYALASPGAPTYGNATPGGHSYSGSRGSFGPPAFSDPARTQAYSGNQLSPQVVQISPEQMNVLSGYFRDIQMETTTNYNLPSGAVQVTVHEHHPVDVEGLILQIGQRLRTEFHRAAQNRKPNQAMPY